MKKYLITSVIILFSVGVGGGIWPLLAQETAQFTMMQTANRLYEAGNYAEAAATFEQLVSQGIADSHLFYNLGNSYFKQGDIGRAILNYKRAARLSPRDEDIRANLVLAKGKAVDQFEKEEIGWFSSFGHALSDRLTVNELAGVTLFVWMMLGLLLSFQLGTNSRYREPLAYLVSITSLLVLLSGFSLGSRLYVDMTRPEGVVISSEVDIKSGPGDQYVTEFTLHSGAEVELIKTQGSWSQLQLPGGQLQGWIPVESVDGI